jgi:hypothetical protein
MAEANCCPEHPILRMSVWSALPLVDEVTQDLDFLRLPLPGNLRGLFWRSSDSATATPE